MSKTLVEIFKNQGNFSGQDLGCNDKNSLHSYLPTYDKLFAQFQDGCSMMEIGVAMGHSIKMWDEYFKDSSILGVDISLMCEGFKSKNYNEINLIQANATHDSFLKLIGQSTFDIIIDDGEHTHQSQIASFELLKGRMRKNGIYIIEDILNPEISFPYLKAIHDNCEVVDLRSVKGRFDDMMLIYRF